MKTQRDRHHHHHQQHQQRKNRVLLIVNNWHLGASLEREEGGRGTHTHTQVRYPPLRWLLVGEARASLGGRGEQKCQYLRANNKAVSAAYTAATQLPSLPPLKPAHISCSFKTSLSPSPPQSGKTVAGGSRRITHSWHLRCPEKLAPSLQGPHDRVCRSDLVDIRGDKLELGFLMVLFSHLTGHQTASTWYELMNSPRI